jgi:hypothetical protein
LAKAMPAKPPPIITILEFFDCGTFILKKILFVDSQRYNVFQPWFSSIIIKIFVFEKSYSKY